MIQPDDPCIASRPGAVRRIGPRIAHPAPGDRADPALQSRIAEVAHQQRHRDQGVEDLVELRDRLDPAVLDGIGHHEAGDVGPCRRDVEVVAPDAGIDLEELPGLVARVALDVEVRVAPVAGRLEQSPGLPERVVEGGGDHRGRSSQRVGRVLAQQHPRRAQQRDPSGRIGVRSDRALGGVIPRDQLLDDQTAPISGPLDGAHQVLELGGVLEEPDLLLALEAHPGHVRGAGRLHHHREGQVDAHRLLGQALRCPEVDDLRARRRDPVLRAQPRELRLVRELLEDVGLEDRQHIVRGEPCAVIAHQLDQRVGIGQQQLRSLPAPLLGELDGGVDEVLVACRTAQLVHVAGDRTAHRLDADLGEHRRDHAVLLVEGPGEGVDAEPGAQQHQVEAPGRRGRLARGCRGRLARGCRGRFAPRRGGGVRGGLWVRHVDDPSGAAGLRAPTTPASAPGA
ncbi:MAG: hypothetical protein ACTHWV_07880 [Brachybacterium sp.]